MNELAAAQPFLISLGIGLLIGLDHPEFAMLFVGVAAATLVISLVIEPATARVTFGGLADDPR